MSNLPDMNHPVELTEAELELVFGGKITQVNGGGNTPGGNAFGVPSENPAGSQPPGQNKGPGNS
jgi:hypothetical protein